MGLDDVLDQESGGLTGGRPVDRRLWTVQYGVAQAKWLRML
ncbi:hypothetical protein [Streptomyces sp. NPDC048213]